jgi:galactokinase/mevalonate kinase-like predicted kinase
LASLIHRQAGGTLPSRPRLRGKGLDRAAFDAVARAVGQQITLATEPRSVGILHDQVVWVTCPVRLDLAGGWSDTPPICTELGGTVLNAAVTLNGQYPVQVIAKLSERRAVTLTSLDLGQRVEITQTPAPHEYQDPSDWAALPKAALILAGVCPYDPREKLDRWLKTLGGGLDITLFSALPKGSGLGTSSILGAAMLACLARVLEEPVSRETLIARTSLLEQMMTTAGGWQDQVGGVVPGVKLIRTSPGPEQAPGLHWTVFDLSPGAELRSRLLLYYTGYKRLAKNILSNVVSRYLSRDPEAIAIIRTLKELAEEVWNDLGAGDVDAFGRGIGRYWDLKKRLDPGSTNEAIERLFRPVERYLTGKVLPGAGGGGFVLMLARDAEAAHQVRMLLRRNPPNQMARFFDFDVDNKGLAVTVL